MKITKIDKGIVALIAAVVVLSLIMILGPSTTDDPTGAAVGVSVNDKVTLGMSSVQPINGLLTVAYDQGFLEDEDLDVEIVEFTSGKEALQAFLGGSLDISISGEVPVMYSALQGNEFYVISQLVEKTRAEIRVVALKDGELDTPQEYFNSKKRKLATSFGGGPEFYTYNFLKKYGINDVELISQKPADMPAALASGSVDAIAVFEPFAFFAEERLEGQTISFSDEDLYSELFVLVADREWVHENKEVVAKVVRALKRAGDFIEENPEEAKVIVAEYTNLEKETIDGIWGKYVYKPALTDTLIDYLTEEAEWAIETEKVDAETRIPDFKEYIYSEALDEIAPEYNTL